MKFPFSIILDILHSFSMYSVIFNLSKGKSIYKDFSIYTYKKICVELKLKFKTYVYFTPRLSIFEIEYLHFSKRFLGIECAIKNYNFITQIRIFEQNFRLRNKRLGISFHFYSTKKLSTLKASTC